MHTCVTILILYYIIVCYIILHNLMPAHRGGHDLVARAVHDADLPAGLDTGEYYYY